nr:MAG TPA: hypothetical protein [Caudoviricetes sp.]
MRSARKCEKLLDRKHAGNKNADACDKQALHCFYPGSC